MNIILRVGDDFFGGGAGGGKDINKLASHFRLYGTQSRHLAKGGESH